MKKLLLLLILISHYGFSQDFPSVTLQDKSQLKLEKLSVNTEISGNYATVTYDMTFYNGLDRVLEGELAFPLAQGQSVSHFAMDLNGKLRSAVVVEKELGRVAYESTIRQRIDPALLEQTQGNNYKARVYPIPAKGRKRIVVTYEQNLFVSEGNYQFNIPFGFKEVIDEFEIEIKCNNSNVLPEVLEGFKKDLKFIKKGNSSYASYKAKSADLNRDLKLKIPVSDVFGLQTFDEYFHITKTFTPKKRIKNKPNSITILWDASYSMQYKRLEEELNLISNYIKYLKNVRIHTIVFSNAVVGSKSLRIKDGDAKELIDYLKRVVYDGGTSYSSLFIPKSDEVLLFSDGLHNLGELELNKSTNLYCINSVSSADHQLLNKISNENNGTYVNLNNVSDGSALDLLKHEAFQFLGVEHQNSVFETYPKSGTVVNENFNLSGKYVDVSPVVLLFGYGEDITERIKVDMSSSSVSEVTKRLWAKDKLMHLTKTKKENKDKIIQLAKEYHLISPYTSMIVLDRIEDYVKYKIEPPSELMDEYKQRLTQSKAQQQRLLENIADRREELQSDYSAIREWYDKDFVVKPKKRKRERRDDKTTNTNNNQESVDSRMATNNGQTQMSTSRPVANHNIDTTKATVFGTVTTADDGLPLPGASVIVKGTTRGAQTDFDGKYVINAEPNEILTVSYVGMKTAELTIGEANTYDFALDYDGSLDEVVVVGYGTTTKKAYAGTASVVTTEQIESKSFSNVSQSLAGEAQGVTVINTSGQPSTTSTVRIRGFSSINASTPLYVIDGVPYTGSLEDINPASIKTTSILKDATAAAIYGSRGANGVIIITTKNAPEENLREIEILNEKIAEQSIIKPWDINASYMEYLNEQKSVEEAYVAYLKIRENYRNTPSFFLDVADFFEAKNSIKYALRVATNLIEIELDNHELIRALGYKLEQYKKYDLAVYVYQKVLELRPEHPQSYRDLALAHEANGEFDEALKLFLKIINGDLLEKDEEEMYYGIEQIAYVELCHLVNSNKKYKELREKYKPIETDIRVLVDWNHGETDLDLYIKNPSKKVIYYGNDTSEYGDRLSEDMTEGYGPESFWIKKAQKGDYQISVDYFSDRVQKITGPTSLKVTIYRNYGRPNEGKTVKVLRLNDNDSKREVDTINI